MYPRETLVKDVKLMDTFFHKYHEESKDGLMRTANVIGGLVKILVQEFPQYSEQLLHKFAMCRTMRRMKWVKQQMTAHHEETLRSKRKKSEYAYNQGPKNQTKNTTQTEQNTEKIIDTPNTIQATKNTKKPRILGLFNVLELQRFYKEITKIIYINYKEFTKKLQKNYKNIKNYNEIERKKQCQ